MCPRWKSFANFIFDMGSRKAGMTIDRIDNDGNYTPKNCRWATRLTQNRNQRKTRMVSFAGKTMSLSEWAEVLGAKRSTLYQRLFVRQWPLEKALIAKRKTAPL